VSAQTAVHSREEVARALDRIAGDGVGPDDPSLLERVFDWLVDHLPGAPGMEAARVSELIVKGLALAIVVTLVVALAIWVVRQMRARRGGAGAETAVRERVSELRGLAREARARGELALALRYLLFALVVGLGQRGDLVYRDAWTNRELLARGEPSDEVNAFLLPLVRELEAKEFGRAPVEAGDVDRLAGLCDRWLGPEVLA